MFRRLLDGGGPTHPRHHRRPRGRRPRRRQRRRGPARSAASSIAARPLCRGAKRCALLHDGRVLRLPGHHRRRRQPPGLPDRGARRHAHRDPGRQAGGRNDGLARHLKAATMSSSSARAPPALRPPPPTAGVGLATLLLDENQAPGGQIYRAVTADARRRAQHPGRRLLGGRASSPRRGPVAPRSCRARRSGASTRRASSAYRRAASLACCRPAASSSPPARWSGRSRSPAGRCRA